MKYLVIGLGNIGAEYAETRHNAGFIMLDYLARKEGLTFRQERYGAVANLRVKNAEIVLLKPSTFMNLSGSAVRYWMQKEKIPAERILVIVDDVALPYGTLRLKPSGSDAGHNGLKDIAASLGTTHYARLRFGIGNDYPRGEQIKYVLGRFKPEEEVAMSAIAERTVEILKSFCLQGIDRTMNACNLHPKKAGRKEEAPISPA